LLPNPMVAAPWLYSFDDFFSSLAKVTALADEGDLEAIHEMFREGKIVFWFSVNDLFGLVG
jgi:hypothetical protein